MIMTKYFSTCKYGKNKERNKIKEKAEANTLVLLEITLI